MKRYRDIWPKICDMDNLRLAHKNARKDKHFYKEVKMVDADPDYYLGQIHEMLVNKTYQVSPYEHSVITDKGKERELAKLPYFPDRIIQWAIMLQMEPIFMETFCNHTCASIKRRGISHGRKLMIKYLKDKQNTRYCLKFDVSKFYPSINQDILMLLLKRKIKDNDLLDILDRIVHSTESGIPIGSYLSQFFANFYLTYFDHWLKEKQRVKYVIRYMDDVVIFASSKQILHQLRYKIDGYLKTFLNLRVKPDWQIFPVDKVGVSFIGFRFYHHNIRLRTRTKRAIVKLYNSVRNRRTRLNQRQWSAFGSYIGWLIMCNGFGLRDRYLSPLVFRVKQYYRDRVWAGGNGDYGRYVAKLNCKFA